MENKPSVAGTRTNAPKPACFICSERGHLESMSSSDPAQRIKNRYAIFFKRNNLTGYKNCLVLPGKTNGTIKTISFVF